jgi:hypothetical protein
VFIKQTSERFDSNLNVTLLSGRISADFMTSVILNAGLTEGCLAFSCAFKPTGVKEMSRIVPIITKFIFPLVFISILL